jgi:hypothetical protein
MSEIKFLAQVVPSGARGQGVFRAFSGLQKTILFPHNHPSAHLCLFPDFTPLNAEFMLNKGPLY